MAQKTIQKTKGFSLIVEPQEGFNKYVISCYISGNKKASRTLCYKKTHKEAKKVFDKLLRSYKDQEDKRDFIKENVVLITKHNNPNYKHSKKTIYSGSFGSKLNSFLKSIDKEPLNEGYRSVIRTAIDRLYRLTRGETTLTKTLVQRFFQDMTKRSEHLSPQTIKSYKNAIRKLAKHLKKNPDILLEGIKFYSKKQLDKMGIKTKDKGRGHLERSEIARIIPDLMGIDDDIIRTALFIQLWTGCRPNDVFNCHYSDTHIIVETSKTGSIIKIPITKEFNALKILLDLIPLKNLRSERDINDVLKNITLNKLKRSVDRYSLRHTVLTQRCTESTPLKIIAQEAGHMSLRMLDENYVRKIVKENKAFNKVVKFKEIEKSYRGFLLETCLNVKFPELLDRRKPKDKLFKDIIEVLTFDNIEEEMSLL